MTCSPLDILFMIVKFLDILEDGKIHIYFFLQHPQIQKKSQYIKYLCCDDVRTLHQWVNGIRIAKVGLSLSSCSTHTQKKRFSHFLTKKQIYEINLSLCSSV